VNPQPLAFGTDATSAYSCFKLLKLCKDKNKIKLFLLKHKFISKEII